MEEYAIKKAGEDDQSVDCKCSTRSGFALKTKSQENLKNKHFCVNIQAFKGMNNNRPEHKIRIHRFQGGGEAI